MKPITFGLVTSIQVLIITILEDVVWKRNLDLDLAYVIAMKIFLKIQNIYMINWKSKNMYQGVTNNDIT